MILTYCRPKLICWAVEYPGHKTDHSESYRKENLDNRIPCCVPTDWTYILLHERNSREIIRDSLRFSVEKNTTCRPIAYECIL